MELHKISKEAKYRAWKINALKSANNSNKS
jgi:hypothetical protein